MVVSDARGGGDLLHRFFARLAVVWSLAVRALDALLHRPARLRLPTFDLVQGLAPAARLGQHEVAGEEQEDVDRAGAAHGG